MKSFSCICRSRIFMNRPQTVVSMVVKLVVFLSYLQIFLKMVSAQMAWIKLVDLLNSSQHQILSIADVVITQHSWDQCAAFHVQILGLSVGLWHLLNSKTGVFFKMRPSNEWLNMMIIWKVIDSLVAFYSPHSIL